MILSATATLVVLSAVSAQDAPSSPPADSASPAVTVNGKTISQATLNTRIDEVLKTQTGGQQLPEALAAQLRDQVRSQVLESMIENSLLDAEVRKEGITATEDALIADLKLRMKNHFIRQNMTQVEFEEILKQQDMTLDQFLKERSQDDQFKELYLQTQLIEKRFPNDVKVTDEEIKARYDRDLDTVYSVPEQVQASHILISVDETASDDQRGEAKSRITEILASAKKPDADFAALAAEHSSCPSSAKGGDLGFFPARGRDGRAVRSRSLRIGQGRPQ